MTLDEAIKHAEEVAEEKEKLCKFNDDFNFSQPEWRKCAEEHRQLAEWLKELKQLREQARLIPVSERPPEKDDLYLVYFNDGEYNLAYFSHGTFSYSGVIAWMPLPEPYKESEG